MRNSKYKHVLKWTMLTSLLLAFSGCFPQAKNPVLVSDVSSFYLDDTIAQAKAAGVDYRAVLNAAISKNRKALQTLFGLTSSGVFKGQGADSHASMLWTLLAQWGDRSYSEVLASEPPITRQSVITFLDFAAAFDYSKTYPLTHRLGKHTIPFGG